MTIAGRRTPTREGHAGSNQDHGGIPMAVTVALSHPDQALDLALGEVLAIAVFGQFYSGTSAPSPLPSGP
jgi:hypothetical protein